MSRYVYISTTITIFIIMFDKQTNIIIIIIVSVFNLLFDF